MKQGVCVLFAGQDYRGDVKSFLLNESYVQRIVVVQRRDGSGWTLPGGKVDSGESLVSAARREFAEETGLKVPAFLHHLYSGIEIPGWMTHCYFAQMNYVDMEHLKPGPGEAEAKWGTWQDLFDGPYSDYYKALNSFIRSVDVL